jgi:hypothetical protein
MELRVDSTVDAETPDQYSLITDYTDYETKQELCFLFCVICNLWILRLFRGRVNYQGSEITVVSDDFPTEQYVSKPGTGSDVVHNQAMLLCFR